VVPMFVHVPAPWGEDWKRSDARISFPPAEPMISSCFGWVCRMWNGNERGSVSYRPSDVILPFHL